MKENNKNLGRKKKSEYRFTNWGARNKADWKTRARSGNKLFFATISTMVRWLLALAIVTKMQTDRSPHPAQFFKFGSRARANPSYLLSFKIGACHLVSADTRTRYLAIGQHAQWFPPNWRKHSRSPTLLVIQPSSRCQNIGRFYFYISALVSSVHLALICTQPRAHTRLRYQNRRKFSTRITNHIYHFFHPKFSFSFVSSK